MGIGTSGPGGLAARGAALVGGMRMGREMAPMIPWWSRKVVSSVVV